MSLRSSASIFLLASLAVAPAAQQRSREPAGVHVIAGAEAGPTVMVLAGLRAGEAGAVAAAEQMKGWSLRRGRLVIVAEALRAAGDENADLDRRFGSVPPQDAAARAIWRLLERERPSLLLVLRDGAAGVASKQQPKDGAVHGPGDDAARELAARLCAAANEDLAAAKRSFAAAGAPAEATLARAATTHLGIPAFVLTPSVVDQPLPVRARQHRLLTATALQQHAMLAHGPHVLLGNAAAISPRPIRVALYTDRGAAGAGPGKLRSLLAPDHGFVLRDVCGADVRDGALDEFDVAVFPGGSGSGQAKSLGQDGRDRVRAFVRRGGGYVGFCAGSYLAANNYDWSLRILDADVIDREHWKRGRAHVEVEWTGAARALRSPREPSLVLYANGPILAPAGDDALPDFETLAVFRGEVADNGAPRGVMPGTPAVARGSFGKGTVVCSSPHPEQTAGLEGFVRALIRTAVGR